MVAECDFGASPMSKISLPESLLTLLPNAQNGGQVASGADFSEVLSRLGRASISPIPAFPHPTHSDGPSPPSVLSPPGRASISPILAPPVVRTPGSPTPAPSLVPGRVVITPILAPRSDQAPSPATFTPTLQGQWSDSTPLASAQSADEKSESPISMIGEPSHLASQ